MSKKHKERKAYPTTLSPDRVDIIIPVYNQLDYLRNTVAAIENNPPQVPVSFIFVDDASSENVKDFCEQHGRYYRNFSNKGFAATCNFGVRRSDANRFVLLNSDTIPCRGWLDSMLEMEADIVSPLLLFPEESKDPTRPAGKVQCAGFAFNHQLLPWHRFIGWLPNNPRVQQPRTDLQGTTGACMLIKKDVWKKVNGFDEEYGSYFEDSDFCIRAKTFGYTIGYQPKAVVYHHVGASWDKRDNQLQMKAQMFVNNVGRFIEYDEWNMV